MKPYFSSRNPLTALLCASILATGLTIPERSDAAVGALLSGTGAGIPVMVVGGVSIAAGVGIAAAGNITTAASSEGFIAAIGIAVLGDMVGAAVGLTGLVILDGSPNQRDLAFGPLNESSARELGVSEIELETYNHELDELNAVREDIESELAALPSPSLGAAHRLWQEMRPALSPETFSVAEKISGKLRQR